MSVWGGDNTEVALLFQRRGGGREEEEKEKEEEVGKGAELK